MELYVVRLGILAAMVAPIALIAGANRWPGRFSWLTRERRWLLLASLVVVGTIQAVWVLSWALPNPGNDARAYWSVNLEDPYVGEYGASGFFPYSPVAAVLVTPLSWLSWPLFLVVWYSANLVAVAWLARRELLIWLVFPPLVWLLAIGNIEVFLGVAVVLGFRWPWLWSTVALTKVTPAIGLLWFAARREWGALAQALGVTLVLVVVTWAFLPMQWSDWLSLLSEESPAGWITIWVRLPAAAAIVIWGAMSDRKWTVLVAALLAVPHFWFATLGGLVALAALGFHWTDRQQLPRDWRGRKVKAGWAGVPESGPAEPHREIRRDSIRS